MKDKEKHINEIIDRYAIDKAKAQLDQLVHTLFVQAFPPEGLPESLSFVSTEDDPVDLDEIIEKYSPYYKYTKTTSTKYDKSGKQVTKQSLKMKLINPRPYRRTLVKLKLIKSDIDDV